MFPPEEAVRTIFIAIAGFAAVYWAVYWYRARKAKEEDIRHRSELYFSIMFNHCPVCGEENVYVDGYCDDHRDESPNPPVYVGPAELQDRLSKIKLTGETKGFDEVFKAWDERENQQRDE